MTASLNLNDINAFVIISQQGSFTKAAQTIGCSRSQLSRQLNKLEKDLGVCLISRSTRQQQLTESGQLFFEQCLNALQNIEQAMLTTVEGNKRLQGNININSVGGIIGEEIISILVTKFLQQYPEININLDFSSPRVNLIEQQFDLVFRMGELPDSGLIARKLLQLPIETLASPAYLKQYGQPENPKQLSDHHCISGSVKQWTFLHQQQGTQLDISIKGRFKCANGRAMLNSAKAHNGIVRLPRLYCIEEIEAGLLVPVFNDWKCKESALYLLYQQDKYQPLRLRTFIEFVVKHFNELVLK